MIETEPLSKSDNIVPKISQVLIREARERDISDVVKAHMSSFENFFLTSLGPRFLGLLYREIIREPGHVCIVALSSGQEIIGFAAGVPNLSAFYRRLARRKWHAFALASIRFALVHPSVIPRLWRALTYEKTATKASCPACLMSIVTRPGARGKGVGRLLVTRFLKDMAHPGIDMICLLTDRDGNEYTNGFYRRMGFVKANEFVTQEGRWMNEYVIQTRGSTDGCKASNHSNESP